VEGAEGGDGYALDLGDDVVIEVADGAGLRLLVDLGALVELTS
jgi:hypothetical protein